MVPLKITPAYHRALVLAASIFFLSSIYLCSTRLLNNKAMTPDHTTTTIPTKPISTKHVSLNDADLPMSYGGYMRPPLTDLTLIGAIPPAFVPTPKNKRRLVVVGDIHGMDSALDALLKEANFNEEKDHLVSVGDMVSKGPDSPAVVARLMQLNASAVRGNHEDRLLLGRSTLDTMHGVTADQENPNMQHRKGKSEEVALARTLDKEQLDWLAALPVILTAEPLPLLVVHAGLVPGIELESQDPWAVMNMRTLAYPREELRKKAMESPRRRDTSDVDGLGDMVSGEDKLQSEYEAVREDADPSKATFDRAVVVPLESRTGEKWTIGWDRHQEGLKEDQRRTIIYGHDAREGFKEGKYTLGLDSGCVKGNSLTAAIIEATSNTAFKYTTVQVGCTPP
ncbi:hypothetical protein V2G26_016732 [Clonostachys chloroleuca]